MSDILRAQELKANGERIWNLGRMFNVREGFSGKMTSCLKKFFTQPLTGGPTNGVKVSEEEFERTLDEYYTLRGWNSKGIPKEETLKKLI